MGKTKSKTKKQFNYWQGIFAAFCVIFVPLIATRLINLYNLKINNVLFMIISAVVTGLIVFGLTKLIQNKKNYVKALIYIALLIILSGTFSYLSYQLTDEAILKKDWPRISDKHLSFEYPEEVVEFDISEIDQTNADIRVFQNTKEDRLMINMLLSFKDEKPSPEDSLASAVMNSLQAIGATDIEWYDPLMYSNIVSSKIKYKIDSDVRNGFGLIYSSGNYYELLLLIPNTRDYSPDYLERVIQSIQIVE